MRGTIPGSLHSCENTTFVFFDTQDSGAKTLLLVSTADASKLGTGVIALDDALAATTPLQQVKGISTPDAASYSFVIQLAAGQSFSTYGFLSNGQGKNLNLDRNVQTALPGALSCLGSAAPQSTPAAAPATTSGFATTVKPSATVTSTTTIPTTPPAAATTPAAPSSASVAPTAASSSSASAAQATPSTVVIDTTYLLTSFINVAEEKTTDGKVSARQIQGGHITGKVNGTILPFGSALFQPNLTASTASPSGNASNASAVAPSMLLSATYSFITTDNAVVFAMAQTPLSRNYSTEALLMEFTATGTNASFFSNLTILGKATTINSTLFRIDAYTVNSM
ncbi:hypothetical protein EMMF5_002369 [Cystobasidiomycetes sp. EMM_F5]